MRTVTFLLILPIMGWSVLGGDYYKTGNGVQYYVESSYQYTWFEAFFECHSRNMTLYTFEDQSQFDDLYRLLTSDKFALKPPYVWVGAVGLKGKFVWIKTHKPLATHLWSPGNPDNSGDKEHCLQIWNIKKYVNDCDCFHKFGFVCEENNMVMCNAGTNEGKYKGLTINLIQNN